MVGLLHETNWDDISIQMICDRADVARSSFYVHFDNKIALLDHVFVSSEGEIKEFIAKSPHKEGEIATLSWLVDHISGSKELYYYASRSISGQVILSRFKAVMHDVFKQELDDANITITDDETDFILGGVFALIQRWIDSGAPNLEGQLKKQIFELAHRMIDNN